MDSLSLRFAALADPTRRAILARLAEGETTVGDLARPFTMSLPAVSRHLGILERAGFIERKVDAQWRRCVIRPEALEDVTAWLERYRRFWDDSLSRLADYVETLNTEDSEK